MISSKEDLIYYLGQDRIALGKFRKRPRIIYDYIWKYQILLRKTEYIVNCKKGIIYKLFEIIKKYVLHRKGMKLGGYSILLNSFRPGLSIAQYVSIVVNSSWKNR